MTRLIVAALLSLMFLYMMYLSVSFVELAEKYDTVHAELLELREQDKYLERKLDTSFSVIINGTYNK